MRLKRPRWIHSYVIINSKTPKPIIVKHLNVKLTISYHLSDVRNCQHLKDLRNIPPYHPRGHWIASLEEATLVHVGTPKKWWWAQPLEVLKKHTYYQLHHTSKCTIYYLFQHFWSILPHFFFKVVYHKSPVLYLIELYIWKPYASFLKVTCTPGKPP